MKEIFNLGCEDRCQIYKCRENWCAYPSARYIGTCHTHELELTPSNTNSWNTSVDTEVHQ